MLTTQEKINKKVRQDLNYLRTQIKGTTNTPETIYNAESRLVDLSTGNIIDVSLGEDFTKTCGTDQSFTIVNSILRKPFRLELTGGNLLADLFPTYTLHWVAGSSLADYTAAAVNYLYCEVRSEGELFLFFEL